MSVPLSSDAGEDSRSRFPSVALDDQKKSLVAGIAPLLELESEIFPEHGVFPRDAGFTGAFTEGVLNSWMYKAPFHSSLSPKTILT